MIVQSPESLIDWSEIIATGTQAGEFLQGQLTQDVLQCDLAPQWSLVLSPTSEIVGLLFVTKLASGYSIVVESADAEKVLTRLRRFVLRVDVEFSRKDGIEGPFRTLAERIEAGMPASAEFSTEVLPHAFGKDFVSKTISFSKGCFTGQELVGRLDARGSNVPWRFVHFVAPNLEIATNALRLSGPATTSGPATVISSPTGVEGLAIVHRSLLGEELAVNINGTQIAIVNS